MKRGPFFFLTYFKESIFFDIKRKTDTSFRIEKFKQNKSKINNSSFEDGLLYVASFSGVIENTLSICEDYLGKENFPHYQYIDLGCGKGKSLILYLEKHKDTSNFPPIGIEYDKNLYEIANKNIVKICEYSSNNFNLILDSATNVNRYTQSKKLIIYLYNSFKGKTLDKVLDILQDYIHLIIYIDPQEEIKFRRLNYKIIARKKGKYNANSWLILKSNNNENNI